MSGVDVDVLAALAEAATPGPWEFGDRQFVAGVMPDRFGEGKCSNCVRGEPSWVGRRDINGKRMLAHVHTEDAPWWEHGIFAARDSGNLSVVTDADEYGYMADADATYIAAANPAAVLALVGELRAARAALAAVADAAMTGRAARVALVAVEKYHQPGDGHWVDHCLECNRPYPCPTVAAVRAVKETGE